MTTALALKEDNAVAAFDYGAYAGTGFEDTSAADFKPSFLRVLQGLSPQIETVPGAKPGLIIDTVTNELFETVNFIPAVREHVYGMWKPRGEGGGGGGGFGGIIPILKDGISVADPEINKAIKAVGKFERGDDKKIKLPWHPDGEHQLIETVYMHGVQVNGSAIFPVTIPFSSTGLPVASSWFTIMYRQRVPGTGQTKPLFAYIYKLGTVKKSANGNSWYVFTQTWGGEDAEKSALDPKGPLFQAGAAVYESIKAGKVNVDYAQGGSDGGASSDNKSDEEIPF